MTEEQKQRLENMIANCAYQLKECTDILGKVNNNTLTQEIKPAPKKALLLNRVYCKTYAATKSSPKRYFPFDSERLIKISNKAKAMNADLVFANRDTSSTMKLIYISEINEKGPVIVKEKILTKDEYKNWRGEAAEKYNITEINNTN